MSEKITFEVLETMTLAEIQEGLKNPDVRPQLQELMRERRVAVLVSRIISETKNGTYVPKPKPEAIPAVAPVEEAPVVPEIPVVEEPPVVVEPPPAPVVDEAAVQVAAYDAELKAAEITAFRDEQGNITRFVCDYQVKDEETSEPIGRPTHFESGTLVGLLTKIRVAHENATRAFSRLKKQKATFTPLKVAPVVTFSEEEIIAQAKAAIEEKDVTKTAAAIRQLADKKVEARRGELTEEEAKAIGRQIGAAFLQRHLTEFYPCEANKKIMGEYLDSNNMEFTLDNMEIAFADLNDSGKLAPLPYKGARVKETAAAPLNPAPPASTTTVPAAPIPAAPVAAPVVESIPVAAPPAAPSQPVAAATVPTPVATAIPSPATRRPGVNGGIAPGSFNAPRPVIGAPTLTKKDIARMKPEIMRAKLKDPNFVKQLVQLGIRVR